MSASRSGARRARRTNDVEFIGSAEALQLLGVKPASLYTYVSRGLVRTQPQPGRRTKLYLKSDVEKLRSKGSARDGAPRVSNALRYGEPIVQTWISDLTPAGPRYRGVAARELLRENRSFEYVADLLWTGRTRTRDASWPPVELPAGLEPALKAMLRASPDTSALKLFAIASVMLSDVDHVAADEFEDAAAQARRLMHALCGAAALVGRARRFEPPKPGERIAEAVARGARLYPCGASVAAIDKALVLAAEHELSAPTFSARVCASTGADIHACVAAAVMAQSGPMQVGGAADLEALIDGLPGDATEPERIIESLRASFGLADIPCFRHPLYERDPRSVALLEIIRELPDPHRHWPQLSALVSAAERIGQFPNIFGSLVILSKVLGMPDGSAAMLHTLGRTAGWIAHVLEQRLAGAMLRPRARYMGPST